jgi:UDP-N-acetylglucosamine acyltransferase
MSNNIHATAMVHASAQLDATVHIGPWCYIGENVKLGSHTILMPHAVIHGPTTLGEHNHVHSFAVLGGDPQDLKFHKETTQLHIGHHNTFREYCNINRGTYLGGAVTTIGHHNYFMANTHVAHDCIIGNHNVMANYVALAGHVVLNDYIILSGYSGIQQRVMIGSYCFIGGATRINQDVLPFLLLAGNPPKVCGLNKVGLRRHGFTEEVINFLKEAYKIVFRTRLLVTEMIPLLEILAQKCHWVSLWIESLKHINRGFIR